MKETSYPKRVEIDALVGETVVSIEGMREGSDEVVFTCASGRRFRMHHDQDCCESVYLQDVVGGATDLLGVPLLVAREDTNRNETPVGITPPPFPDSYTWTFYNLATVRGHVTLRWLGESNGYYGESVDIDELKPIRAVPDA